MKKVQKNAVEEYQCVGCSGDGFDVCFKSNFTGGIGCGSHVPGTFISGIGSIILGLPKGFHRLGIYEKLNLKIYEHFEDCKFDDDESPVYNIFNVPVWKYLNEKQHTLVRGLTPRLNEPFIHIFLEDCREKINCIEITKKQMTKENNINNNFNLN